MSDLNGSRHARSPDATPGRDDAIDDAIDVLLRVCFSIDIVEDDGRPISAPTRVAYFQNVHDDVSSAIEVLRRVRGWK